MLYSEHFRYNMPELSDAADITRISENFEKLDTQLFNTNIDINSFDKLAEKQGNVVTETLSKNEYDLDTWTSIIKNNNVEIARKVDVEMSRTIGSSKWKSTITIGDRTITIIDEEISNGWKRTVV